MSIKLKKMLIILFSFSIIILIICQLIWIPWLLNYKFYWNNYNKIIDVLEETNEKWISQLTSTYIIFGNKEKCYRKDIPKCEVKYETLFTTIDNIPIERVSIYNKWYRFYSKTLIAKILEKHYIYQKDFFKTMPKYRNVSKTKWFIYIEKINDNWAIYQYY